MVSYGTSTVGDPLGFSFVHLWWDRSWRGTWTVWGSESWDEEVDKNVLQQFGIQLALLYLFFYHV
jgi:hypothetical protein